MAPGRSRSARSLLAMGLLGLAIVSYVAERGLGGGWASWNHMLGLALIGWYLWIFLRDHSAVVLTSFHCIYYSLGMLASAAIIGTGVHIIEIDRYGTANGSFWIMMMWFVAGMEITRIGYDLGGRIHLGLPVRQLSAGINKLTLFVVMGAVLAMAAYVLVLTGGPLLNDVDRVRFWRTMAPAGTSLLPSLVNQTFFFAAFYFLWQRRTGSNMLLPAALVLGYVLTALFVLGQKFSIFVIFLNIWLLLLPGILPDFQPKFRFLAMLVAAVSSILVYTAATYLLENRDLSFIITRAALQAQLLWSVLEEPNALSLLLREPACYFGCGASSNGMDYISHRYLPEGRYTHYAEIGNALSGFMPALSILTGGLVVSFAVHLAVSFVLGFLQRKMVAVFGAGNPIYGFLLFKVHFSLTMMWFAAQEGPWRGMLATLALIVVYRLVFARWGAGSGGVREAKTA